MTLSDAIETFTADGMRFALADAGTLYSFYLPPKYLVPPFILNFFMQIIRISI